MAPETTALWRAVSLMRYPIAAIELLRFRPVTITAYALTAAAVIRESLEFLKRCLNGGEMSCE